MRHLDFESLLLGLTLLLLALLATIAMVLSSHAAACLSIDVPPQAVLSNYDGDTFTLFTLGPGGQEKFRVEGIDTPELSRKKGEPDQPGALEAREFTRHWLAQGVFTLTTCGKRTIDRTVASVTRNGEKLSDALRAAGLGH